jgi:serine/threonine protein kinase
VYRARDLRLGRDVAIKILPHTAPAIRSGFGLEQEARAAAALNHSNVLSLHDVGSENGVPYAVFELLEGRTLAQRLETGPLPVRKAVDYAVQICRGLAAAHARGVVHRDLKPDNVFLTADGQIKILDFGPRSSPVAPSESPLVESGPGRPPSPALMGTVGYVARAGSWPSGRCAPDIFSVGAILRQMLAGRLPFAGETPVDTLAATLTQDAGDHGGFRRATGARPRRRRCLRGTRKSLPVGTTRSA